MVQAKNQGLALEKLRVHAFAPCFHVPSVGRVEIAIPTLLLFFARWERTFKDTETPCAVNRRVVTVCMYVEASPSLWHGSIYKGIKDYSNINIIL